MLNRIKIVTSLMLVLAIFGLLQLTSGGLFFNALKNDKENFTVLQTIRQQQSTLNASWVALLQTRNTLNRAGIRYMMDQSNIGSGATVNDLMQIASTSLKQAEKNWAAYEALREHGKLPASFEVVYGHAWKVAPKKTADGRAIVSFDAPRKKIA